MVSGTMALVALVVAVFLIIFLTAKLKMNAFMVLILVSFIYGFMVKMPLDVIAKNIHNGFGNTLGYIGVVIIAGTIMGIILEKTGAAFSMTNFILKLVAKKYPQLALSISGYITSIAVFCDSGFVILNSINKALAKKSNLSITVTSTALATGLFASHCLIPPATGPIAAANIIGANLGEVMIYGAITAVFAMLAGFIWATFFAKRFYIEPKLSESYEDLMKKYGTLPPVALSFMPIVVPILLILTDALANPKLGLLPQGEYIKLLNFFGDPMVALIIGAMLSLLLVRKENLGKAINEWFTEGIKRAALIVAITGAGGAFGQILKASPIGDFLSSSLTQISIGIFLPFIISAALKISQGSSTVALLTGASIVMPLLQPLGINPALAVVAVGAGAMTFSHANDSYFWVVTQFSDMETKTAYKVFTTATLLEGCTAMCIVAILSIIV